MQKKLGNGLLLIIVSATWLLIGWLLHSRYAQLTQRSALQAELPLLEKASEVILNRQLLTDAVTPQELSYAAIRGMIARTHDPNAVLFTPPISEYYDEDIAGEVGVSGIRFDLIDQQVIVREVYPERPAARAGIQVGDIILGINDVTFDESITSSEVSLLLRGAIGPTVKITVERNRQVLTYDLVRAELPIFTTAVISDEIGYIKQILFPLHGEKAMEQQLQALQKQAVSALIWDLRDSRGGAVAATQAILNQLIEEGVLYSVEFKDGRRQQFTADGSAQFTELPIVVLINQSTYSSSEMVAIALADHHRAVLIGTPTEGKGTIQDTIALDDQHLLRVTVAKWLSPAGEWIQGRGVTPDIEVVDDPQTTTDEVLDFAKHYIDQEILGAPKS